ncbi:MAG: hypothetical protein ABIH34_03065 [Nanoarchaeota archaeon]
MTRTEPLGIHVTNYEVKSQNLPFDYKALYVMLHEWMLEHEFCIDDKDTSFPETMYYESRQQDGRKEIWCWWRPKYIPEDNPFYRYALNINLHWLGARQQEIVKDGRKHQLQAGEFWCIVQAVLEVDYQGKWRSHWLLKHLLETFWKRFIWHDMERHKHELYKVAYQLRTDVSQFLDIRQHTAGPQIWWPKQGI